MKEIPEEVVGGLPLLRSPVSPRTANSTLQPPFSLKSVSGKGRPYCLHGRRMEEEVPKEGFQLRKAREREREVPRLSEERKRGT
uniref:Uncharacterized protein n=1 Tax=Meloidogyne enterolobii TaxID=390850 RepID=A0A6V7U3D7_MELEN|nr:unnamed protein product [Meloidogyne enterolobii]